MLSDDVISKIFSYICTQVSPIISKKWHMKIIKMIYDEPLPAAYNIMELPAIYYGKFSFAEQVKLPNLLIPITKMPLRDMKTYATYKFHIEWQCIIDYTRIYDMRDIFTRDKYMLSELFVDNKPWLFNDKLRIYFRTTYANFYQYRLHINNIVGASYLHKIFYNFNIDTKTMSAWHISCEMADYIWQSNYHYIIYDITYREYMTLRSNYVSVCRSIDSAMLTKNIN